MKRYDRAQTERFEGVFSLLLTPFHSDGSINWSVYDPYVDWQLEQKPHGLFGVCGSSEMKWLSLEERLELARRAVQRAGDVPVVVTANIEPDVRDHKQEMQRIIETGVTGVVLVPPPGVGADQSQLGEYFAELADSADCPVFIYEWPMVHPYLIDADVYADLANRHNVWGIKDTTCTIEGIRAKIEGAPDSVVYQANHPFMLDSIRAGARGIEAISTSACADRVIRFWNAAVANDPEAEALHQELVVMDSMLCHGGAYPATAKLIARLRGMDIGLTCRNPSATMKEQTVKAVSVWFESVYGQ